MGDKKRMPISMMTTVMKAVALWNWDKELFGAALVEFKSNWTEWEIKK